MIDLWHYLLTNPAAPVYRTLPLIVHVPAVIGTWAWGWQ